jgi:hypothetical protein
MCVGACMCECLLCVPMFVHVVEAVRVCVCMRVVHPCMCVCICMCVYVHLSMCVHACLCVHVCVCVPLCAHVCSHLTSSASPQDPSPAHYHELGIYPSSQCFHNLLPPVNYN